MKARCVEYIGDRATVVIAPSWLGWLFGYRTTAIDLARTRIGPVRADGTAPYGEWYAPASGRGLEHLPDHDEIRNALDFREVGSEPRRGRALIGGVVAP